MNNFYSTNVYNLIALLLKFQALNLTNNSLLTTYDRNKNKSYNPDNNFNFHPVVTEIIVCDYL